MAKLKALRGGIGAYGRVKANGIVEVSDTDAKVLLATKRFVVASEADIAKAQKAQSDFLKVESKGATSGFAPMPDKPLNQDRLSAMIEAGQIDRAKAKELVALQINLSDDEVREAFERDLAAVAEEMRVKSTELEARESELTAQREALAAREQDLEARKHAHVDAVDLENKALAARSDELDGLAKLLDARQKELDALVGEAASGAAENAAEAESAETAAGEEKAKPKAASGAKSAK